MCTFPKLGKKSFLKVCNFHLFWLPFASQGPVTVAITSREIERVNSRSYGFSEQVGHWDLPMHEGGVVMDVAVGPGKEF